MEEGQHLISVEEHERENDEYNSMFYEFGFAGYSAQRLENHMFMLLSLSLVVSGKFADLEKAQASSRKKKTMTAGTLRTALNEHLDDEHLKNLINAAVDRRNYLTHQFFREHEHDELTPARSPLDDP